MSKLPNLIFMMTDHQRADSIGMTQLGAKRQAISVCPTLNQLAEEGTYFPRTYSTCPLCVPARTALATGKYPTKNGVVFNDWRGERAEDHLTIHQILYESGYDIAHIGVDHIRVMPSLKERINFAKWIDKSDHQRYLKDIGLTQPTIKEKSAFKRPIRENQLGRYVKKAYSNTFCSAWNGSVKHFKDSYFCQQATNFLKFQTKKNQPFALFLYLWAPHPPFWVPEPYRTLFPPEQIELPCNINKAATGEPKNRRHGIAAQLAEDLTEDDWRQVWSAHLGLVRLADDGLSKVIHALKQTGQFDHSLIVYTSDHGDHLGQHRMFQKMEMYEQAICVPSIICAPDGVSKRLEQPISHLDLMPTILDLLGCNVPNDLDGRSLFPIIAEGQQMPEQSVYCQYSGNPKLGDTRRAIISRRHKYIYDPNDRPELYDLQQDPMEMVNRADDIDFFKIRQELHQDLKSWSQQHGDWLQFDEVS